MKKIVGLAFVLSTLFTMTACGQTAQSTPSAENTEITQHSENIQRTSFSKSDTDSQLNVSSKKEEVTSKAEFNFETKTVMLNSGYEMPIYGLGTYSLHDVACRDSVTAALSRGVRLIDTAHAYGNEVEIGEEIRNSGIPREEIFVITKLYPDQFSNPKAAIEETLEKLDIGYIDMMLLHHPGAGDVEIYHAMEQAVADGKIRSIGLSNWYVEELTEFLPQVNIIPALVQNEIHPYYQENDVIPFIQDLGIVVQGWYPLGGRGHTAELFGFELTGEEMARINAIDRGEKHDWY